MFLPCQKTLCGIGTTRYDWNKLPVCDVKARQRIIFQQFAPFLALRAGLACLVIYVQTVSSDIV